MKEKNPAKKSFDGATLGIIVLMTLIGFFVGKIDFQKPETSVIEKEVSEKSRGLPTIVLQKREGDKIFAEISGAVKITWADNYSLEDSGIIYFSQIPTDDDLKLRDFKYLGNAKTHKFYPTNSYPARGTEARYRRFFQTKEEAISAGFKPSKLVK